MEYSLARQSESATFSAEEAYEMRRSIFKAVQEAQRREHEAFVKMQEITRRYTRELLNRLSQDLMKISAVTENSELRRELEYISGCDLGEWTALQKESVSLNASLQRAEQVYRSLDAEFRSKAPFGWLSVVFASPNDKSTLQSMLDRVNTAKRERDACLHKRNMNDTKRQDFARRFLRGCLAHVDRMQTTTSYDRFIVDWTARFGREMGEVWRDLCAQEQRLLDEIIEKAQQLKYVYQPAR